MNEPTDSNLVLYYNCEFCQVCGQKGHGNHFGAVTCRACAAFFRRVLVSKHIKPCEKENKCDFFKNGWFNCKMCRLQRCWDVGMTAENFQFGRDPLRADHSNRSLLKNVPPTINTFLCRPNLIVFTAPRHPSAKTFIDVQFLLEKGARMLEEGSESPLSYQNRLIKLAFGHQTVRGSKQKPVKVVMSIGRDEVFAGWEDDIGKVAKWLTYFDEFQGLPHNLRVEMLKCIWRAWTRLEQAAVMAMGRKQRICDREGMLLWNTEKEHLICFLKQIKFDISWCSRYTLEQLKVFKDDSFEKRAEDLIQMLISLDPTDEELSYMLAQLCFHHVAKRYEGEIAEVAERLQESIANDLHDYYVTERKTSNYLGRVARMMKVNNLVQEDINMGRTRAVVAEVFDVFCVEFSHPDMFVDI